MIEAGIEALLNADATLAGLVNSHIYPVFVPQNGHYPCLSYQSVTARYDYTFQGAAASKKSIQFDAWGTTYEQSKDIQAAVRQLLSAYSGTLSDGTHVLGAFIEMESDMPLEPDSRLYRALSEYTFHYREP